MDGAALLGTRRTLNDENPHLAKVRVAGSIRSSAPINRLSGSEGGFHRRSASHRRHTADADPDDDLIEGWLRRAPQILGSCERRRSLVCTRAACAAGIHAVEGDMIGHHSTR